MFFHKTFLINFICDYHCLFSELIISAFGKRLWVFYRLSGRFAVCFGFSLRFALDRLFFNTVNVIYPEVKIFLALFGYNNSVVSVARTV